MSGELRHSFDKGEEPSVLTLGKKEFFKDLVVIAGHCTIDKDNGALFLETAHALKELGVDALRGGVWKPRTHPQSYQGDDRSLDILVKARKETGLPVVTEVMEEYQIGLALDAGVDVFQIGARNALNYGLLRSIGRAIGNRPEVKVLYKKPIHMGHLDEWIAGAEYLAVGGNKNVLFCLRGFQPAVQGFRNQPDESAVLLMKERVASPIIVDPCHSVGKREYVPHAALAGVCYGADGLIIETHIAPSKGIGDDPKQSITPEELGRVMKQAREIWAMLRDGRR